VADAKAQAANAQAEATEAKKQAEAANAALVAANASLATERKARATDVVTRAMTEGRITPTEKDAQIAALASAKDFMVAANAVLARPPQLPQGHESDGLGKRKGEMTVAANASVEFEGKVAKLQTEGKSYDQAWATAKAQFTDLYARMGKHDA
jgi:hypothetical protein